MKLINENSFINNSCEEHKKLLDVLKSSHGELKLNHETLLVSHEELSEQHASLIKTFSKKIKMNESSSHESSDQLQHMTNSCDVGKKHISTSCDDLLDMPCSSQLDTCSTSLSYETNLLKENNELKREVKNLSNKLERCYNSKVTFEHMLKTQRNYGDKRGLGFKKKMTKGERKRERKMKKLQQRKLSHTMCYRCHEVGHLANVCPNIEKLKLKKEEERLKHVKCFKCRTLGHLTSMCPTKELVKQ
jgi:cytochrome c553